MTKHTPGPWRILRENVDGDVETQILSADGNSLMGDARYYPWVPAYEADWLLIAAAPELLEALRKAVLALAHICESDPQDARLYGATYQAVSDAIAKATGDQQ